MPMAYGEATSLVAFSHPFSSSVCTPVAARVYRAAEGGERACNSRTSCIEGEMLAVTKFKSKSDTLIRVMMSIMPYNA